MMLEEDGVHPDEGTIHAWLDGALDAPESARLEVHVAGCTSCGARVAEARGLIAGASRVVGLLDDEPAPLIKPASTPTAGTDLSVWRLRRVTPARAAIAATLVVAVGIALTSGRLGVDSRRIASDTAAIGVARVSAPVADAPAPAASPAPSERGVARQDSVLNSAIERRLAKEQPPRTVAPAPGVAIPVASAPTAVASSNSGSAEAKVLAGQASMREQRDAAGVRADRTRAGVGQLSAAANDASQRLNVAAKVADTAIAAGFVARGKALGSTVSAGECYLVESAAAASWASVRLPMVIAMDSAGTNARVLTPSGGETEARAYLQYNGADSALFRLRRIGYSGNMTLAATGATRAGTIRSTASTARLSEVVVTSADANASQATKRAAAPPAAAPTRVNPAAPAATPAAPSDELAAAPAVRVTARQISCPNPR
jgi:hypothetical protein